METIYRDYAPRNVQFFYVYKALAHPETNGYVTPFTLEERLLHIREAQRTLGSKIPWICDTMTNDLKHALGDAPNSELILDPAGKVVRRRAWSDPKQLRADLEELVGRVDHPTQVADLNLPRQAPPKAAASGIVPRLRVPPAMTPLKIVPAVETAEPYYVKLRAEVERSFFLQGKGKLYLTFRMDPIYQVHWNNAAAPLEFKITTSSNGAIVSPSAGQGPKVEASADIDPREFLLDIQRGTSSDPLTLEVWYFACQDSEGWCKPVRQQYTILLEADRDGGWVQRPQPPGPARRPGDPAMTQGPLLRGLLTDLNSEKRLLTLRTPGGQQETLYVSNETPMLRNGTSCQFADLERGDEVMLEIVAGERNQDGHSKAARLRARSLPLRSKTDDRR